MDEQANDDHESDMAAGLMEEQSEGLRGEGSECGRARRTNAQQMVGPADQELDLGTNRHWARRG